MFNEMLLLDAFTSKNDRIQVVVDSSGAFHTRRIPSAYRRNYLGYTTSEDSFTTEAAARARAAELLK